MTKVVREMTQKGCVWEGERGIGLGKWAQEFFLMALFLIYSFTTAAVPTLPKALTARTERA